MAEKCNHNKGEEECCDHVRPSGCEQTLDEIEFEKSIFGCAVVGDLTRLQLLVAKRHPTCLNDQDRSGFTCLHYAARNSHVDICKYLLAQAVVDVNLKTNSCQSTPLHRAAYVGSSRIVEMLLERGARVCEQDCDGKTALHKCVERLIDPSTSSSKIADELKKCAVILVKSDKRLLDMRDKNGNSPVQIYSDLLKLF